MYNNCIFYQYITLTLPVPDLGHFERPRRASVQLLILETLYKKTNYIYKFIIIYLFVFDTLIKGKIILKNTHFNLTLPMYTALNRVTNRLILSSYYKSKISGLFLNIIYFYFELDFI